MNHTIEERIITLRPIRALFYKRDVLQKLFTAFAVAYTITVVLLIILYLVQPTPNLGIYDSVTL